MAKLKRWVIYLIVSIILAISLVGLGVGLYYILKPNPDNPEKPGKPYELTKEQQQFVDTLNGNPKNISGTYYTDIVYKDGSLVDVMQIEYVVDNVAIIKDSTGVPRFYTFESLPSTLSATETTRYTSDDTNSKVYKMVFTPVDIKLNDSTDYKYIATDNNGDYYVNSAFAIVYNNANEYFVVSLKTGEVVLEVTDYFVNYDSEDFYDYNYGDIVLFSDNYLVTKLQSLKVEGNPEENDSNATAIFTETTSVINLVNPLASKQWVYEVSAFANGQGMQTTANNTAEQFVTSKVENGYMVVVTTGNTYVYAPNPVDGNLVEALSPISNSFESIAEEITSDTPVVTISGVNYNKVSYSTVYYLPNNTFLVEKSSFPISADDPSRSYGKNPLNKDVYWKYTYNVFDITAGSYITTTVGASSKVEVLKSNIDGYIFVKEQRFSTNSFVAKYYDYNFNLILSYDYGYNGELVYYNADKGVFVTNSEDSAHLIDVKGYSSVSFPGYKVYSKTASNDFIILEGLDNYVLYNIAEAQYYYFNFEVVSQFTDDKLIGYVGDDCFYLLDTKNLTRERLPYLDKYSVNALTASLGYYVEFKDGKYLLTTTSGSVTKQQIDKPNYDQNYKIFGSKIYSFVKNNGKTSVIVSDYVSDFGKYTSEEIEENIVVDAKYLEASSQSVQLTAFADKDLNQGLKDDDAIIDNSNYNGLGQWTSQKNDYELAWDYDAFKNVYGKTSSQITVNGQKSIPSYDININFTGDTNGTLPTTQADLKKLTSEEYGFGVNYYTSNNYSRALSVLPITENSILHDAGSAPNNWELKQGQFDCAWDYYFPYGHVYILKLHQAIAWGSKTEIINKFFVILVLDNSTYVSGSIIANTTTNGESTVFYTPQSNASVYIDNVNYKSQSETRYVGGFNKKIYDSEDFAGTQVDVSAKTLVPYKPNQKIFKSAYQNTSKTYYADMYSVKGDYNVLSTEIKLKVSPILQNMYVGKVGCPIHDGVQDPTVINNYLTFYANDLYAYNKEKDEKSHDYYDTEDDIQGGPTVYDQIQRITGESYYVEYGPVVFDKDVYESRTMDVYFMRSVELGDVHCLYRYYTPSGNIKLQARTLKEDGEWWGTADEHKNFDFKINGLGNKITLSVPDGTGKGFLGGAVNNGPRNIDIISLLDMSLTLKLNTSAYKEFKLYTAVDFPESSSLSATDKPTGESLLIYEDAFNRISYGFVTNQEFADRNNKVVGAKRSNLSKFANYTATAGYTNAGYGIRKEDSNINVFNPLGTYQNTYNIGSKHYLTDLLVEKESIIRPIQTASVANFNFYYINYEDIKYADGSIINQYLEDISFGKDKDNIRNKNKNKPTHYWWDTIEGNTGITPIGFYDDLLTGGQNGKFEIVRKDTLERTYGKDSVTLPTYSGEDTDVKAPVGYEMVGWYLAEHVVYDAEHKKTIPVDGTIYKEETKSIKYFGLNYDAESSPGELNFYAIYKPKEYTVSVSINKMYDAQGIKIPTADQEYKIYYINGEYTEGVETIELATTTYHSSVTVPLIYVENNGVFYSVKLLALNNSSPYAVGGNPKGSNFINATFGNDTGRKFYFTNNNLAEYTENDGNIRLHHGLQYVLSDEDDKNITIGMVLTPVEHTIDYTQSANNHVYRDTTTGAIRDGLQITPTLGSQPEISGKNEDGNNDGTRLNGNVWPTKIKLSNSLTSGVEYKLTYSNFKPGFVLTVIYTFTDVDKDARLQQITQTYIVQRSGTSEESKTICTGDKVGNNWDITANLDKSTDTLTLTFTAKHGYFAEEDASDNEGTSVKGKFIGNLKFDVTLDTQRYNVSVSKQEQQENSKGELVDVAGSFEGPTDVTGNISISELITASNEDYTFINGLGSTLLINMRQELSKIMDVINYYTLNQYISGLSIQFNGDTYTGTDATALKQLATQISSRSGILIRSVEADINGIYPDNADLYYIDSDNNTFTIVPAEYITKFIQLMYGVSGSSCIDLVKGQTLYYGIVKFSLQNENNPLDVYVIMTNLPSTGVSIGIMFDISENFKYDCDTNDIINNKINVDIKYVKYQSSVVTSLTADSNATNVQSGDATVTYDNMKEYKGTALDISDESGRNFTGNGTANASIYNISPSNSMNLNFIAKKGYYFKEIVLNHGNGTSIGDIRATITFVGFSMDYDKTTMHPIYKYEVKVKDQSNNWVVIASSDEFTTSENICKLPNMWLEVIANSISVDADNSAHLIFRLSNITKDVTVNATYGVYTLLDVGSEQFTSGIGYQFNGGENANIQIFDGDTNRLAATVALYGQEIKKVYAVALYGANGLQTYSVIGQGEFKNSQNSNITNIVFMIFDYQADTTYSTSSGASISGKYIHLKTELIQNASYELAVQTNNTAELTDVNKELEFAKTQKYVINTSCGKIVSIKISPKEIKTYITSDINFSSSEKITNIYQEYLDDLKDGTDKDGNANIATEVKNEKDKYIDDKTFYDTGTENGQIASNGTTINYYTGNYASASTPYYDKYATLYKVYGNQIVVSANTQFGYMFKGFTLKVRVDVPTDDTINKYYGELNIPATKTGENGEDLIFTLNDDNKTATKLGNYKVENEDKTQIIITITNLDLGLFQVILNYQAVEYTVTYNTSASFGDDNNTNTSSSPVSEFGKENDGEVGVQDRKFIYNVKSLVDEGNHVQNSLILAYSRVGYDLIGWSFSPIFKDANGNTISKDNDGTELANNTAKYKLATDGGNDWFNQVKKILNTNSPITMYAVWKARTYDIVLNYNETGSTMANRFTVKWKFDQPLSVNDVDADDLNFATGDFGTGLAQNALSRLYRLGYQFDGWYFGLNDNSLVMYNPTQKNPLTYAKLNYDAYQSINEQSAWNEAKVTRNQVTAEDGSTVYTYTSDGNNKISLYAKWTANKYTLVFDLNDINASGNDGNTFKNLSINGFKNINDTNINIFNKTIGTGSSEASLGGVANGKVTLTVEFDSNFADIINAYAQRYGYKFTGWYSTRSQYSFGNIDDTKLIEGQLLNLDLLLRLLNSSYKDLSEQAKYNAELAELKNKYKETFTGNVLETTFAAESNVNLNGSEQSLGKLDNGTYGNLILLHARWEALDYTINIDLNNWNNPDFTWTDGDYYIAGSKQDAGKNAVTTNVLKLQVKFDTAFDSNTTQIYYNNTNYTSTDLEYTVRGKEYVATGSAYQKLINIITSYGYNLGNDGYDFALTGNGSGLAGGEENVLFIKADTVFGNANYKKSHYYLEGETNNGKALSAIDLSGHNKGDRHKFADLNDVSVWGSRTFTTFVLWTIKDGYVYNLGYEVVPSHVGGSGQSITIGTTNTTITSSTAEDDTYVNYAYNTGEQKIYVDKSNQTTLNHISADMSVYNNKVDITYAAPTGQYASELILTFMDKALSSEFAADGGQIVGQLKLTFGWDKHAKHVIIQKAEVRELIKHKNVDEYTTGNFVTVSVQTEKNDDGTMKITIGKYDYMFEELVVETTNYKVTQDTYNSLLLNNNINDQLGNYTREKVEPENNIYGNLDICFVKLNLTGLKGNVLVSASNKAQTYDVNYYRYIRPTDTMQTHIDEDEGSDTYGQEVWADEFANNWNQYEVYKTSTYRYGDYPSTTYNYATGFGFDSWYYYQGHIILDNFDKYANYTPEPGSNLDEQTFKVFTVTDVAEGKLDSAINNSTEAYKHLADIIGTWEIVETYRWNGTDRYELVNSDGTINSDEYYYGKPSEDGGYERFTTDHAKIVDGTEVYQIYIYQYNYIKYAGTKTNPYKYYRTPITSNLSLVGVYNPTDINKVHYYVWKNNRYEDRDVTSTEYILGQKQVAEVTLSDNKVYNYVEYWELGTNDVYYQVGFSGIERQSDEASLSFLLQFVNPNNLKDKEHSYKGNKLVIDYSVIKDIITAGITVNGDQITGVTDAGDSSRSSVINLAHNLLRALIIQGNYSTIGHTVADYLNNYEVVKYFNLPDGVTISAENGFDIKGEDEEIKAQVEAVVNSLSIENLDMLLDAIATDYFGFILKNPTSTIGQWPADTYFAGWYLVGNDLFNDFIDAQNSGLINTALTFNSVTWAENINGISCLNIISETQDIDGNIIYTLQFGISGQTYEVTRFKTVSPDGIADMLSRVDREIYVFGAYNARKFTMSLNGCTNADVQMGTTNGVADIDGNNYQYVSSDVRYVVLTENQLTKYKAEIAKNADKATALATALKLSSGSIPKTVYGYTSGDDTPYKYFFADSSDYENIAGTFEDAKSYVKTYGGYILAFVYQINSINSIVTTLPDGSVNIKKQIRFDKYITNVADSYYHYNSQQGAGEILSI